MFLIQRLFQEIFLISTERLLHDLLAEYFHKWPNLLVAVAEKSWPALATLTDWRLSGAEVPEVGRHKVRQHQLHVLQDEELQEGARVELHALQKQKLKGTVRPDWICMRVVSLDILKKVINRYRFLIFSFKF
jgi:hypothetical protein